MLRDIFSDPRRKGSNGQTLSSGFQIFKRNDCWSVYTSNFYHLAKPLQFLETKKSVENFSCWFMIAGCFREEFPGNFFQYLPFKGCFGYMHIIWASLGKSFRLSLGAFEVKRGVFILSLAAIQSPVLGGTVDGP